MTEILNKQIEKKVSDIQVIVKFIKDHEGSIRKAREAKTLTLDAYREAVSKQILDAYNFQLSALLKLKKDLGEEIEEKYTPLLDLETRFLEVEGEQVVFKGDDLVNDFINKTKTDGSQKAE